LKKRKRGVLTEEENSGMQAVFVDMTKLKMSTGECTIGRFDKQLDALVKLLINNDPSKPGQTQKLFDNLQQNIAYQLGEFFHKPVEEMSCLLQRKYLMKKKLEYKKRKDDHRKLFSMAVESDIKK
jgi:hypothetical protein